MNEEEFFNRAINRICKDYDYSFANEFRLLFLKKEKEINNLQSKIDKAIEIIDLITPELWNISNKMTYRLKDVKNILKEDK